MLPLLSDALAHWAPRLLAGGVDPGDLERARAAALGPAAPGGGHGRQAWEAWFRAMLELGDEHAALARQAEAAGHALSAGEAWVRAGLTYHFAQFALFDFPDLQAEGQRRKVEAFARAAPLLRPPIERLTVEWEGLGLPVLLRRPPGTGPRPWVLLVPGLDSTKEEFHAFGTLLLARGLAVAACDGPGQGEVAAAGRPWRPGDEAAALAVLAALRRTPGLDPQGGALLGVSFGGYLAAAAAARAGEWVRACAVIGGCFSLAGADWERLPPLIQADFRHFCGAASLTEARAVAGQVSLAERLRDLRCPLLLFHGDRDGIFPPDHAQRTAAAAGGRAELHLLPGANHVCNNRPHHYRPYTADWLADQLSQRGG